jgi:hypothetical protein
MPYQFSLSLSTISAPTVDYIIQPIVTSVSVTSLFSLQLSITIPDLIIS